jgi:TonB-linked SusC/RagA family outer membrane protein
MRKLILFMAFLLSAVCLLNAQEARTLSGKVVDENGEVLVGAGVMLPGGTRGTVTDLDGKYILQLKADDAVIVVSFMGYATQEIVIGNRKTIDVSLKPDLTNKLNETVVIGYGTTKKQDLTGSVATVKMSDIDHLPITSIDQALQGRIAGVDIVGTSGAPGSASSINIRGARSITASNEPLIVVDGVMDAVTDLADINPSDIANISVLKDASSTAIYGSKGANGVIMITTRQGNTSRPTVNLKMEVGVSQIARDLDVMNAEEFVRYRNSSAQIDNLQLSEGQVITKPTWVPGYDVADYANDTDWIDAISRTAVYQNYYLSVSGKAKDGNYFGALAYTNDQGIIKGSGMERYSGRLNLTKKFADWLHVGLRANFSYQNRDLNKAKFGGTNISNGAMYLAPILGINDNHNPFYENGALINTPYASITNEEYYQTKQHHNYTGIIRIVPIKQLSIRSQNNVQMAITDTYHYWPSWMPKKSASEGADAYRSNNDWMRLSTENTITYKEKFGKNHNFDAMAGFSAQSNTSRTMSITAKSMLNDESKWDNLAAIGSKENYTISSSLVKLVKMSGFARVNYNYANKYYLTATLRADGSSNFAANRKWGFFPSAALKWNIRQEDFLRYVRWLSQLELRVSYGRTGNDDIPSYRSMQAYSSGFSYIFDGLNGPIYTPSRLDNPNLTWETTDQFNVALETAMFSNRLNITLEGYMSKTKDLLLNVSTMNTTGYSSRLSNLGLTSNMGAELSIESRNIERSKFGWTTVFSIAHNSQKVEDIGNNNYVSTVTSAGNIKYMMYGYKAGYPLNALWGFEYAGTVKNIQEYEDNLVSKKYVYRDIHNSAVSALGHGRYIDQNRDGVLDNNDLVYLGNADPIISGGFQNNFYFDKLQLSVFFTYSYGGKMYNYSELYMAGGKYSNQYRYMLDSWHPTRNPDSDIPRAGDTANVMLPSSFQVHDSSFIRLQDLSLKYTFDLRKTKIFRDLTLGISGKNLYLWTQYNGYDPDVRAEEDGITLRRVDMNAYPTSRKLVFSVNVKF